MCYIITFLVNSAFSFEVHQKLIINNCLWLLGDKNLVMLVEGYYIDTGMHNIIFYAHMYDNLVAFVGPPGLPGTPCVCPGTPLPQCVSG